MKAKKTVSVKVVALLMAVVLLIGGIVGGTLAWLSDKTETVTNTFSVGNVEIDLTETVGGQNKSAATTDVTNESFKIVPGGTEAKDPTVKVLENSEACWVFVEIVESNNYIKGSDGNYTNNTYVDWEIADDWTLLSPTSVTPGETVTYVYYKQQSATTDDVEHPVLKNNEVSYSDTLTKEDLKALGDDTPNLTFAAYAIQSKNLTKDDTAVTTAADAWAIVSTN